MKTVALKFNAGSHATTPTHPDAKPGITGKVSVYRVVNVPDAVAVAEVIRLFNATVIPFPDKLPTPWTLDYSQLGAGNVVTGGVLIRADQVQPGMTFRCTSYPGVGIRTCRNTWTRKTGGETTIMIDCGVGVSSLELVPSDELEVLYV
jgi:hypothetical protein